MEININSQHAPFQMCDCGKRSQFSHVTSDNLYIVLEITVLEPYFPLSTVQF